MQWYKSVLFASLIALFAPSIAMAQPAPSVPPARQVVSSDHHKKSVAHVQNPHQQDPGKERDADVAPGQRGPIKDKAARDAKRHRSHADRHGRRGSEARSDAMPYKELPPDAVQKHKKDRRHGKKAKRVKGSHEVVIRDIK